jgi:hypothetical protein
MLRILRRIGIAIGSLTIAYLALALVGGVIGLNPAVGAFGVVVVVVLGALIYRDIVSRESTAS